MLDRIASMVRCAPRLADAPELARLTERPEAGLIHVEGGSGTPPDRWVNLGPLGEPDRKRNSVAPSRSSRSEIHGVVRTRRQNACAPVVPASVKRAHDPGRPARMCSTANRPAPCRRAFGATWKSTNS